MTIAVITSLGDVTADLVLSELHGRGVPVVRLDPAADLADTTRISVRVGGAAALTGTLSTATRTAALDSVRAVYWRRPTPCPKPESPVEEFATAQARAGFTGTLVALPTALHVNHPSRNRAADYKVAQLETATALGLAVPETLITTVPDDARAFVAEQGKAIYKPVRPVHINGADGRGRTVWTRTVTVEELDESVALCPHLFQACVPKVADIRLAAVGRDLFATRIDTRGDHLDWRWDQSLITCTPMPIPRTVADAVRAYLDAFGLTFGAFDFALDPAGRWWFIECNPNGQWAFVDPPTVDAITRALADTLEKGTPS
ncbi:ATP-grasp ribosomal peptide maturase [Streptomyces sp. BI20]|uniref:ATP-grasp ribosomal peptide maturase n=1 Tax=Streptomyces sp. BI20 TaxID=3403460 RepID=UPI003C76A053